MPVFIGMGTYAYAPGSGMTRISPDVLVRTSFIDLCRRRIFPTEHKLTRPLAFEANGSYFDEDGD